MLLASLPRVTAKTLTTKFRCLREAPMPKAINELFRLQAIGRLAATLMEVFALKRAHESGLNVNECKLGFREQCKVVWNGLKKGYNYDGCTAVPDFDFGADCCGEHDYHYQDKTISRAEADRRLRECLRKKGYFVLPWVYWAGVRTFGWWFYNRKKQTDEANSPGN